MHPGTAAVMARTSGTLLLSALEASVAEFRRWTSASDEQRASSPTFVPYRDARDKEHSSAGGWRLPLASPMRPVEQCGV
jgi:hypothetical protein